MSLESKLNYESGILSKLGNKIKNSLASKIVAYSLTATLALGSIYSLGGCECCQPDEVYTVYYLDNDGDGFGDPQIKIYRESPPVGYVTNSTDCDDNNKDVYPNAPEICDLIDNQCPNDSGYGTVDEGFEIINFPDPYLEQAIRDTIGKPIGDITPDNLIGLTILTAPFYNISDLSGLECATNLNTLNIYYNYIFDISPLSGLTNLNTLELDKNQINDISPLSGLTNLNTLDLSDNHITDISPLSGLTNLNQLYFGYNHITDISSLSGLTNLTSLGFWDNQITDIQVLVDNLGISNGDWVYIYNNPLSTAACQEQVPILGWRGVYVELHDECPSVCNDDVDNDSDGKIDYPNDPECSDGFWISESYSKP